MQRLFSTIICILFTLGLIAQPYQYKLQEGEHYFLDFSMIQQTETEQSLSSGDASLDIHGMLILEVQSIMKNGNFEIECYYSRPELGFFSPQSKISISSQDKAFSKLKQYLLILDKSPFRIIISPHGNLVQISKLDSLIQSLYLQNDFEPGKDEFIVKTIDEAFGETAFRSLVNIVLNVYDEVSNKQAKKESFISFNAASVRISNNFYYTSLQNEKLRIQGVGVIHETVDSIEHEQLSLVNMTKGKQTYDFLYDRHTGWIIEGMSKQKIQSLGVISKHASLPEGLKIPSYTDTEYQFKGGRYEESDKKK